MLGLCDLAIVVGDGRYAAKGVGVVVVVLAVGLGHYQGLVDTGAVGVGVDEGATIVQFSNYVLTVVYIDYCGVVDGALGAAAYGIVFVFQVILKRGHF